MTRALLAVVVLMRLTTASSLSALTLAPPHNKASDSNLTANMNRVTCVREPYHRALSDFSTCIPSLFRLYATPSIHAFIIWDPGDFKKWGPETDLGGCYILVDGGHQRDVFAVESLLGPAMWAVSKCFVGEVEGRNVLAKTRVGPGNQWWLNVVLERTGIGGNASVE